MCFETYNPRLGNMWGSMLALKLLEKLKTFLLLSYIAGQCVNTS